MSYYENVTLEPNGILFSVGDRAECLYLVKSGEVKIYEEFESKMYYIGTKNGGDVIGEEFIVEKKGKRKTSVVASQETEIIAIKLSDLKELLKSFPNWIHDILGTLVERTQDSYELIREHNLESDQFPRRPASREELDLLGV